MADQTHINDNRAPAQGTEKPLGESLLGDDQSGGLAGQGGMVDLAEDDDEGAPEVDETDDHAVADKDEVRQDNGIS